MRPASLCPPNSGSLAEEALDFLYLPQQVAQPKGLDAECNYCRIIHPRFYPQGFYSGDFTPELGSRHVTSSSSQLPAVGSITGSGHSVPVGIEQRATPGRVDTQLVHTPPPPFLRGSFALESSAPC